jgi:hypothetical protein
METKKLFPWLWYIQRYLKMYQKPLSYFLNKYAAEIFSYLAMVFSCSAYHRGSVIGD